MALPRAHRPPYFRNLRHGAPEAVEGFQALDGAVFNNPDAVIPLKYTELMAVTVALTSQCSYCIEAHSSGARMAGASEEELAETVMVAAAPQAGAAVTHGWQAIKFFNGQDSDS